MVSTASAQRAFYATDESLEQYNPPEWYQDAKLGYWVHWGLYSVPSYAGDHAAEWYGRWMYVNESDEPRGQKTAAYHRAKYGDPSKFGYKDFIPLWKTERFDANEWADLFKSGGAKFFTMMAMHHDNYPLWDSKTTPINAATTGPKRDFVAEMERAVRSRGLHFGVSNHSAWNSRFFGFNHKNGYDAKSSTMYGSANPDAEDVAKWWARTTELVERYRPDLVWFDWCWNIKPYGRQTRMNFLSWYYNKANDWGVSSTNSPEVVVAYKGAENLPIGSAVLDVERGGMSSVSDVLWMNDTSLGLKSWSYAPDEEYRSSNQVVDMLLDIISKNGVLLLNIGPKADGEIPELARRSILSVGEWLSKNGEGVYATRAWDVYGEGPTHPKEHMDGDMVEYTADDVRFVRSKDSKNLYIHFLGYKPSYDIRVLASANIDLSNIKSAEFVSTKQSVKWRQNSKCLRVTLPSDVDKESAAYTVRLSFDGEIPKLKK